MKLVETVVRRQEEALVPNGEALLGVFCANGSLDGPARSILIIPVAPPSWPQEHCGAGWPRENRASEQTAQGQRVTSPQPSLLSSQTQQGQLCDKHSSLT